MHCWHAYITHTHKNTNERTSISEILIFPGAGLTLLEVLIDNLCELNHIVSLSGASG